VLIALILITRLESAVFVLLAWAFVIGRLVHAYIHTGANDVRQRFYAMLAGTLILLAMWVIFAARTLSA
jgi:hypothetical protein